MSDQPQNGQPTNGKPTARKNAQQGVTRRDPSANLDREDPGRLDPNMPPNLGRWVMPHIQTFSGLVSTIARSYKIPDEAIKHSLDNARHMRNDLTILECLEARQRAVAGLNWHIEVDGPELPKHKALQERLTNILKRTWRFTEYRRSLLEAIWFGRQAVQHRFGFVIRNGRKDLYIKQWLPIMGDKLVFRLEDGTEDFPADQVGVRVGPTHKAGDLIGDRAVVATDMGLGVFLAPWERNLIAVHKHMIEDAAYEDPLSSGSIHGIGIRSRIYWTWYQKQELLALFMEYLERSALGFEIWYYDDSNPKGKEDMEAAAKNRVGRRNIVRFPLKSGEERSYYVEHIEPGAQGAEALQRVLSEYFGHQIKRYILGQTLTSEAAATGLGSGVAELHLQTLLDIVKYDATNLDETITNETVNQLKVLNDRDAADVDVRFVSETTTANVEEKLAAFERAYNMGAKIKEKDVMEAIDAAIPEPGEPFLHNGAGTRQDGSQSATAAQISVPEVKRQGDAAAAEAIKEEFGGELVKPLAPLGDGPELFARRGEPIRYAKSIEEAAADVEEPKTAEQAKAGNYRMGHAKLHGLPITIETARGQFRKGIDESGTVWRCKMAHHYGYIKRTESEADGDHMDVFIGPCLESELAFVVDQKNAKGEFDEHKCMLGFTNEADAKAGYLASYSPGWKGFAGISAMTVDQFKRWLEQGDTSCPVRSGDPERYAAQRGLFDEDSVERDEDGKFASKGSGSSSGKHEPIYDTSIKASGADTTKRVQKKLLAGMDSLPGQQDLFKTDGEEPEPPRPAPNPAPKPDKRKVARRTIQQAAALLEEKGYTLTGVAEFDMVNMTANYKVIDPDGQEGVYTSAAINEIIDGPQRDRHARTGLVVRYARWVTIGGDGGEGGGGTPVLIGDDGTIHAGPKELRGKNLSSLDEKPQPKKRKAERFGGKLAEGHFRNVVEREAGEWDLDPDDLAETVEYIFKEHEERARAREAAKEAARKTTGLTMADIARLENQGKDYTSRTAGGVTGERLRHFDAYAQELAREQPDLELGNPDDPDTNFAANLWDVLREGKQPLPHKYDPAIVREAAQLLHSANKSSAGVGDSPEWNDWDDGEWSEGFEPSATEDELAAVPFSRQAHDPDLVERFAAVYRRMNSGLVN